MVLSGDLVIGEKHPNLVIIIVLSIYSQTGLTSINVKYRIVLYRFK